MAKVDIHPKYQTIKFTCSTCNSSIETGSTLAKETKVDTCSSCHPFYTGSQTYSNAKGRVERFKTKMAKKAVIVEKSATDSEKQKTLNAKAQKKQEKDKKPAKT